MNFLDKIDAFCAEHHISVSRFERESGISKGLISKWKSKGFLPGYKTQTKMASYMGISVEELMRENLPGSSVSSGSASASQPESVRDASVKYIPVFRENAALDPSDEESIAYYFPALPGTEAYSGDCFAMKITDSSMLPEFGPGDVVIVQRCDEPDHGDIVVFQSPGQSALCRKLVREKHGIVLQPFNRHYDSVSYRYEEMDMLSASFIGKVIHLHRDMSSKSSE